LKICFPIIFKYALPGSRAYIDILETTDEVTLIIKKISAYELNISADELMERFTRGDESRSSQRSGLGLAIAKSLIEIQKGTFKIEIDGDLFKAIITMRK
jgi:signal transduction histidine kinase